MIKYIALGKEEYLGKSIVKHCCDKTKVYKYENTTLANGTVIKEKIQDCKDFCKLYFGLDQKLSWILFLATNITSIITDLSKAVLLL